MPTQVITLESGDQVERITDPRSGAVISESRYLPPQAPSPPQNEWWITIDKFRARFTTSEKVAMKLAAVINPDPIASGRAQAAAISVLLDDLAAASFVDLTVGSADRARVLAGLQALEGAGILAAGRVAQIMETPVPVDHRYRG